MNTLLVYESKYGCAKECAEKIAKKLNGHSRVISTKQAKNENLDSYDAIVIGGSIYADKIRKGIVSFCNQYETILMKKKIGLFVCSATPVNEPNYVSKFFSQKLCQHALAKHNLGGEYRLDKMDFMTKKLISMLLKSGKAETPHVDEDEIKKFASEMNG